MGACLIALVAACFYQHIGSVCMRITITLSILSRLTALRLEAADRYAGLTLDIMIGGISSLVSLEELCLDGFAELGKWPAEVAATLRPLHRLRALVGHSHEYQPATAHP